MERWIERFATLSEDIRVFAPMVREHDEMRAEMRFVRESMTAILVAQAALDKRLQDEQAERVKGQAERKAELEAAVAERETQHKDLRLKYVQVMVGLVGIFMTSLGGIVVAYLAWKAGSGA